jgi:hypothetical protein
VVKPGKLALKMDTIKNNDWGDSELLNHTNVDAIEIDEVQEEEAPSIDKIIHEEQTGMKRSRESSSSSVNESILKKVKPSEKNANNHNINDLNFKTTSQTAQVLKEVNQIAVKNKIEPVIFFKVHVNPSKEKIEKYLNIEAKGIQIEEFKITANNNVLIYTKSNEENEKLVNDTNLFKGIGRLNLNNIDKRPYLIIKNVTYDYMKYKAAELKAFGILDVIEMKNKTSNKSYNFVKVLIESDEKKKKLLNERFIRVGMSKMYLKDFIRPPVQCRKCKGFGHIEKLCKEKYKCAKCGSDHSEENCKEKLENQKCANFNEKHSTYYRGCKKFIDAKNIKLNKDKKTTGTSTTETNTEQSSNVTRTYSSVSTNDELIKKFENMLTRNNSVLLQQTEEIVKNESKVILNHIDRILKLNNMKLCYFVIDAIKTLMPSVKFSVNKMKLIQEAFNRHQLGNINVNNLTEHYCLKERDKNLDDSEDQDDANYKPVQNELFGQRKAKPR